MGTEAGQALSEIVRRKDLERECGNGIFAWGIGNSIGPAIKYAKCAERVSVLEALFTPMKAAPKAIDAAPASIVMWLGFLSDTGKVEPLPEHMLVTSRGRSGSGEEKRTHYALICRSTTPLATQKAHHAIDHRAACNLVSSNPVGASQVTSVVRYRPTDSLDAAYPVLFRAELTELAFVRLADPVVLTGKLLDMYHTVCRSLAPPDWEAGIKTLRGEAMSRSTSPEQQPLFA